MVLNRIKYFLFFGPFLFFSCSNGETNSLGENTENTPLDAKDLFFQNCASCHGVDGKLGVSGASDLSESKLSVEEVLSILENGRNGMPAMKEILGTKEKLELVSEYTLELRK